MPSMAPLVWYSEKEQLVSVLTLIDHYIISIWTVGAMLLGLHIVRELRGVDMEYVHYAIYSMSATIGLIIMTAALFNIYSINYKKGEDLDPTWRV